VDDGSTDGGAAIVERLAREEHGRTRITLVQQANQGPNAARNHGTRVGSSRFVAFLDADDSWEPEKLAKQFALLEATELGMVYCGYHVVDEKGGHVRSAKAVRPELRGRVFQELLLENRISGSASAVLVRRSVLDTVGPFDEKLQGSEDWDMWLRIAENHAIDFVDEDLVAIRQHPGNAQLDTDRMLRNMIRFYAKWFQVARQHQDVCRYWGHLIAEFALRSPDPIKARRESNASLTNDMKRALFDRTGGSLSMHMKLKKARYALIKFLRR